jgi:hypothetical protein
MKRTLERMDGWMDEENRQGKSVEDDFLLVKKFARSEKGCSIELTTGKRKEPAQGVADGVLIL